MLSLLNCCLSRIPTASTSESYPVNRTKNTETISAPNLQREAAQELFSPQKRLPPGVMERTGSFTIETIPKALLEKPCAVIPKSYPNSIRNTAMRVGCHVIDNPRGDTPLVIVPPLSRRRLSQDTKFPPMKWTAQAEKSFLEGSLRLYEAHIRRYACQDLQQSTEFTNL